MAIIDFNFENDKLSFELTNNKADNWIYKRNIDSEIKDNNKNLVSKVNLFYNYYEPSDNIRKKEIQYCFNKLLSNTSIDCVYVYCSDELKIENDKTVRIKIDGAPRFKDVFNIVNLFSEDDDINIILNSDCFLEKCDIDLIKMYLKNDDAFLLSRWEILKMIPFKIQHFDDYYNDYTGCSQDAWIFKGKLKKELKSDFNFGLAGCDNTIANEFHKAGYNVSNPSRSIKVYHYHLSSLRTYGDYSEREKNRVMSGYKFIPSSSLFIEENKNIIFYNNFHNGDIHYSREFVKDIMKKYKSSSFAYNIHINDKDLLKDLNIKSTDKIPTNIKIEEFNNNLITERDDVVYINTWVGQNKNKYIYDHGITLKANYDIYKKIYNKLKIKIEDIDFYIPKIDYRYYKTNNIDNFVKKYKNYIKVLISNGQVNSEQCENFDMNNSIEFLSNKYNDIVFILTDSSKIIKNDNIFYTNEIIKKKNDLNEISYLSTYCDIIIGRSSGPYAFSMVYENLSDHKKTFISFVKDYKTEWLFSENCNHIIQDRHDNKTIIDTISEEIDFIKLNKKRIAFTIILNGLHHLKHNNYAEYIAKHFDYWVVVEGAANNSGSTSWCKNMPDSYHKNGRSIDGTIEYMINLSKKYNNIIFVKSNGVWNSKDGMVNRAIDEVRKITNECFLWEIDIDEQWTMNQIIKSEKELLKKRSKTGKFNVYQFVGDDLIVEGKDWAGEPFIRLWDWKGECFDKHEPPTLSTKDKSEALLSEKMKHYSFYFEKDIKFKNDWYGGHDGLLENWLKLKKEEKFPQHITYLFPRFNKNWDCRIIKYSEKDNKIEDINKNNELKNIVNSEVNRQPNINIEKSYVRTNQEMCEDLVKQNISFQIYHTGRLIFDSDQSDKINLYFYDNYFTLYGKQFSYQGMMLKRKR